MRNDESLCGHYKELGEKTSEEMDLQAFAKNSQ